MLSTCRAGVVLVKRGGGEYEGYTSTSQRQKQEVSRRPDSRNILDDEIIEFLYTEYCDSGTKWMLHKY